MLTPRAAIMLRADDGLAEGGRGGQHAIVVGLDRGHGGCLHIVQRAKKLDIERSTGIAFVFELCRGSVRLEQFDSLIQAATRQSNVARMKLGT